MFELKNEVAAVVAALGVVALVLALVGGSLLLGVAFGDVAALGAVVGGLLAAVGIVGLLGVWSAITSDYFAPAEAAEHDADDDGGPPGEQLTVEDVAGEEPAEPAGDEGAEPA